MALLLRRHFFFAKVGWEDGRIISSYSSCKKKSSLDPKREKAPVTEGESEGGIPRRRESFEYLGSGLRWLRYYWKIAVAEGRENVKGAARSKTMKYRNEVDIRQILLRI